MYHLFHIVLINNLSTKSIWSQHINIKKIQEKQKSKNFLKKYQEFLVHDIWRHLREYLT